jgi:hypothetical protein
MTVWPALANAVTHFRGVPRCKTQQSARRSATLAR